MSDLKAAYAAVLDGYTGFSEEFSEELLYNFPYLDFENIRYVRLIDIPGDGLSKDCQGFSIYDPYPTLITAGFDLDAVVLINYKKR